MLDLTILIDACAGWFLLVSGYYLLLGAVSTRPWKPSSGPARRPRPRLLVLIPAHNEEKVIGDLVSDLERQTYDRTLYRVVVVADHCTDATEAAALRAAGGNTAVLARRQGVRGKGAVLDFGQRRVADAFPDFAYEYIVVFDADNRVAETVLDEIAKAGAEGHEAIQVQVRTKNPTTSYLAAIQDLEYTVLQRVWQYGKDKLGLVNAFAGTGQAIHRDLLAAAGGFGDSLTDDLDLTIRLAKIGRRVKYLHHVATYDEKPDDVRVEIRRRVRWSAGHLGCLARHAGGLILRRPTRLTVDALFYLVSILTPLVLWVSYVVTLLGVFGLVTFTAVPLAVWLVLSLSWPALILLVPRLEGERRLYRAAPGFFVFLLIWMIVVPWGAIKVLRHDTRWRKTPHKVSDPAVIQAGARTTE